MTAEEDTERLYQYSPNLIINRNACRELYDMGKEDFNYSVISYIKKYIEEFDNFRNHFLFPIIFK